MTNCLLTRRISVGFTTSGTARCVNTKRPLTHLSDCTGRGLVMNASQARAATRRTPEYMAWSNMLQRIKQPSYVAKGITICDRWLSFTNFLADMGERPEGMGLGRIDKNGSFEPGNCRWTTSPRSNPAHGHWRNGRKSPTYRAWDNMIQRVKMPVYAERGITVCERWQTFTDFLADMGVCPPGLSLDRIDNDGNYEPGNCRWTDWSTQMKNRRPSAASLANLTRAPARVKAAARRAAAG